uniref:Uncharacterized protein n=1 Tax=Hemiselmis tepida TaxID=464990 RepID=A0A7S0VBV2_9CRYP|mmetsp:Transcript_16233/g.41047  ORF Transcript_16233/g.41047 Transcript_16233/m.41047 type:complete len:333 (+) Transcript_16233:386-1384(+)
MSPPKAHSAKRIYPDVQAQHHQGIPTSLSMGGKAQSKKDTQALRNQLRSDHAGHPPPTRGHPPAYDDGPAVHGASKHAQHGGGGKGRRSEIPEALRPKADPQGSPDWGTGLLGCCCAAPTPGCCYHFLCPCMAHGSNVEYLSAQQGVCPSPHDPVDAAMCGGSKYTACCSWMLLQGAGLGCLVHCGARRAIRRKYGIRSGWCPDLAASLFCPLCAIHQEASELSHRSYPPPDLSEVDWRGGGPNQLDRTEWAIRWCLALTICQWSFSCGEQCTSCCGETAAACRSVFCGDPDQRCCEACGDSCGDAAEQCRTECLSQIFGDIFGSTLGPKGG